MCSYWQWGETTAPVGLPYPGIHARVVNVFSKTNKSASLDDSLAKHLLLFPAFYSRLAGSDCVCTDFGSLSCYLSCLSLSVGLMDGAPRTRERKREGERGRERERVR